MYGNRTYKVNRAPLPIYHPQLLSPPFLPSPAPATGPYCWSLLLTATGSTYWWPKLSPPFFWSRTVMDWYIQTLYKSDIGAPNYYDLSGILVWNNGPVPYCLLFTVTHGPFWWDRIDNPSPPPRAAFSYQLVDLLSAVWLLFKLLSLFASCCRLS